MAESATGAKESTNGYPAGVLAAAVLAATGLSFVLVGSAALWLRGEPISVGDADVVIEPGEESLRRARVSLADMALRPDDVPRTARLATLDIVTIMTSYGKVDCLLRRGRLDWDRLRTNADVKLVAGAEVVVAASSDAWELRRQFKAWELRRQFKEV